MVHGSPRSCANRTKYAKPSPPRKPNSAKAQPLNWHLPQHSRASSLSRPFSSCYTDSLRYRRRRHASSAHSPPPIIAPINSVDQ